MLTTTETTFAPLSDVTPNHATEQEIIITAALAEFVTILLDGAYDIEGEAAPLDVIALCYVLPPEITDGWGAWPKMWREWALDGRAPLGVKAKTQEPLILDRHYRDAQGEYAQRWWGNLDTAATHVAKVIADGLDDGLLVLCDGERLSLPCAVSDCERMDLVRQLAAIAGPKQGHRLLDHIEQELDRLDAEDERERAA